MLKARFKGRISDDRLGQRRFPEAIFSGNLRARLRSTPKISFRLPGTLGTVSTVSWRGPDPPSWWNGSASGMLLHCCYFPPAFYLQYFRQLMQNLDVLLSIPAASTERPTWSFCWVSLPRLSISLDAGQQPWFCMSPLPPASPQRSPDLFSSSWELWTKPWVWVTIQDPSCLVEAHLQSPGASISRWLNQLSASQHMNESLVRTFTFFFCSFIKLLKLLFFISKILFLMNFYGVFCSFFLLFVYLLIFFIIFVLH